MKKLIIVMMLMASILLLSGCQEGMINSSVSITSKEGAGTKTVYVDIYKDSAKIPNGQFKGSDVGNNSKFLLGGGTALTAKLKSICKLDGVTFKNEDKGDFERVTVKYSFSSIADYNAKMKKLADGKGTIKDATLTVNGDKVTFVEPAANAYNSMLWAIQAVYNDSALYDKTGKGDVANNPITMQQMAVMYDVEVVVNGTSKKVDLKEMPQTTEISSTGTFTGATTNNTTTTNTTTTNNNPKTSDEGIAIYVIIAIAAAAGLLFIKKPRLQ